MFVLARRLEAGPGSAAEGRLTRPCPSSVLKAHIHIRQGEVAKSSVNVSQ